MSKEIEEYLAWLRSEDQKDAQQQEFHQEFQGTWTPSEGYKAVDAVYEGKPVCCEDKKVYLREIRPAVQRVAGKWLDEGDSVRAQIALEEIRRLDQKFGLHKER